VTEIDIHHLAAAYALDALDDRERAAFEAHYPSCDVCRADVVEYRDTLGRLAAADPVDPPPAVRDRVMAEIGRTRQLSPLLPATIPSVADRRRRSGLASTLLAAAAAVMLVVAAALVLRGGDDGEDFADELAAVLDQPDVRMVSLVGSDGGDVRVAWSDGAERAAVIGDGLPAPPDGSGYELWLIDESGPIPMQLLDTAEDGELHAVVDIDAVPIEWGITIEPLSGSASPTGPILFHAEA
jgi:anti-sigma-K factor RskA